MFTVATGELADTCNVEGGHVTWNSLGNKLAVVFKERNAIMTENQIINNFPNMENADADDRKEKYKKGEEVNQKEGVKEKEKKQFQDVVIFNIGNCCGGECSNNCEEKAKQEEEERAKAAAARGRGMDPRGRGAPGGRGGGPAAGRGRGDGGRGRGGPAPRGRGAAPAAAKKGMFGF